MLRKTFSFLFAFLVIFLFSQTKIKIIDKDSEKPIAYAKLLFQGKEYYKNTEENGEFTLENGEQISEIQSFGYENQKVEKFQNIYLLQPKATEIEEVKIKLPTFQNNFFIGDVKKELCGISGFIARLTMASYFPYQEEFQNYRFIKSVKFHVEIHKKKKAKVKLVFYKNENGMPSSEIWKSYIVECNSKKEITEFQLKQPIPFPSDGVFVGLEWINTKENIYKQKFYLGKEAEKPFINEYNNCISLRCQRSEEQELWVKGKVVWDTEKGQINHSGGFKNLGWINFCEFENKQSTVDSCKKRLSIQLELTD